ncbi:hypothetical protein QAD02_002770 [Eretmocerus hayati]|uniref:Uncharacterized protein n=1 Tax=Eretmocerus hayati TaxID=131215 RepID=A0ACC2NK95_9HYME|nr:hypothetical protein QAD02_002770 [Eretmocerus hayati]
MSDSGKSDKETRDADDNVISPVEKNTPGVGRGRGGKRGRGKSLPIPLENRPQTPATVRSLSQRDIANLEIDEAHRENRLLADPRIPLENSVLGQGNEQYAESPEAPRSAPPAVSNGRQPQQRPEIFEFPRPTSGSRRAGMGTSPFGTETRANIQPYTSGILLDMKNRQQAFQSRMDEQSLRISRLEQLSAQSEKLSVETGKTVKSHAHRPDVVEQDICYVSNLATETQALASDLDQRVGHNTTCIDNLTGLIDGCNNLINQSNDRHRDLASQVERTRSDLKEISRKGNGTTCSRP